MEYATSRRPALVVLDMGLPGVDGVAVADALRARYGPGLPILAVTAAGNAEERRAASGHSPTLINRSIWISLLPAFGMG